MSLPRLLAPTAPAALLASCVGVCLLSAGQAQASAPPAPGQPYSTTVATTIVEKYTAANLATNQWFQLGFTSSVNGLSVSNVQWAPSFNDAPIGYTSFNTAPTSLTTAYQWTEVVNLTPSIGTPFFIRYTIAPGAAVGDIIQTRFLSNSNNALSTGVLTSAIGNAYTLVDRNVVASGSVPVPGPVPLLGAAAAFGASRRLRRRLARRC